MMLAASRPRADDLGPGPSPADVLTALADEPGLACLWGSWLSTGTSVLIMSRPQATSTDASALDVQPPVTVDPSVVGGGWVGWLGYDAPNQLGFYDHLLRWDEDSDRWSFEALWSRRRSAALRKRRDQLRDLLASRPAVSPARAKLGQFSGPDRERHLAQVEAAVGLIRAGEIYQANICTRLGADFDGSTADAARLFAEAAHELRPRFGAFIAGPDRTILSLSPELFLRRARDEVRSEPIKGTWKRDPSDPADDGADRLRHSAKDVAENVMIVDLVRNDLGRVARPGSVRVEQLLSVVPHPGVWHLASTVTARLRADVGDVDLVAATFPPGSVTGTPKVRAQQAIADIEDGPRGVYTGAIGIAGPATGLLLSVAIRTFELAGGRIELGVGGGITADSVPELEWRECAQKAVPLLRALGSSPPAVFAEIAAEPPRDLVAGGLVETILAVDGRVLRLADHLARLDRSARELYGVGVPAALTPQVRAAAAGTVGRIMVRIVFRPTGTIEVTSGPARPRPSSTVVRVVERPGVWRHKWADRSWLDQVAPGESATDGPLFVAADGTVLETARGNVFVLEHDGTLRTPPLRDDLLPGITRRAILDLARDRDWPTDIASFDVAALDAAAATFWTSSLSGVVAITEVDGRIRPRTGAAEARLREIADALSIGVAP
jgi:para-aminobenzoate synthetase/4-amino-4-deoxychorismate lyase